MRVDAFAAIEDELIARVHRMVWCTAATVDDTGRPRSRVVHTIWDGQTCWAMTRTGTPKLRDLDRNPHVSLAYTSDLLRPVYADCLARWEDDPATKRHVWDLFLAAPPPLGFDPASMFTGRRRSGLRRVEAHAVPRLPGGRLRPGRAPDRLALAWPRY